MTMTKKEIAKRVVALKAQDIKNCTRLTQARDNLQKAIVEFGRANYEFTSVRLRILHYQGDLY